MTNVRDIELITNSVLKAQGVLAQYIAPGGPSAQETIDLLLTIFNDEELVEALARRGGPGSPDLRTM